MSGFDPRAVLRALRGFDLVESSTSKVHYEDPVQVMLDAFPGSVIVDEDLTQ